MEKYEPLFKEIVKNAWQLKNLNEKLIKTKDKWCEVDILSIESELLNFHQAFNLGWKVGINYQSDPESVCLVLPEPGEKIELNEKHGFIEPVKHSGYLCYSLAMNGLINVWIHYPEVKDTDAPIPKILETRNPSEFSSELIANQVIVFLKEIHGYKIKRNTKLLIGLNKVIYNL